MSVRLCVKEIRCSPKCVVNSLSLDQSRLDFGSFFIEKIIYYLNIFVLIKYVIFISISSGLT